MEPIDLLAAEPASAALFFDVDGVLAPIVERPEDARVPTALRTQLARLAGDYALVACVTGRPAGVAREIVGVPELTYAGEHGLELVGDSADWSEQIHAFADAHPWHDLERKPLSIAFHYRSTVDPDAARAALEGVAAEALEQGFRTRWGRMVLEVLPPVDANKGTAVRALLERAGLKRALYAGDDTTDLDGFAALDGLELAVRVAVVSDEGPDELGRRADVVVGSTDAFAELLARL